MNRLIESYTKLAIKITGSYDTMPLRTKNLKRDAQEPRGGYVRRGAGGSTRFTGCRRSGGVHGPSQTRQEDDTVFCQEESCHSWSEYSWLQGWNPWTFLKTVQSLSKIRIQGDLHRNSWLHGLY